jgi:SAM-dependent methyltransferase/peptidoglycan hydrolase CwlO-like protein
LAEFTGERVIPGEVDADLLNEHMARYAFAARLARGKLALDAGCGAGYGAAELARTARLVVAADLAPEAVDFARAHYRLPNLVFERASCTELPHAGGAFELVTAFEVIEHLNDWRRLLLEARRVLAPDGVFLVSTPNKPIYAELRGSAGANPFHVHEFLFEEFRAEVESIFPFVSMFLEHHVEGIMFQPHGRDSAADARVEAKESAPREPHFFLAVCALRERKAERAFVYVPSAANVLLERGRHIALLQSHIALLQRQLAEIEADRLRAIEMFGAQKEELERSNRWAEELNLEVGERRARVAELQEELGRSNRWAEGLNREIEERRARVAELQAELERSNRWAGNLNRESEEKGARIVELQAEVERNNLWAERLNREIEERRSRIVELQAEVAHINRWAEGLNQEVEALREAVARERESAEGYKAQVAMREDELRRIEAILAMARESRWLKLGRKVGLGPAL